MKHYEDCDRERKELDDKIKQCDLKSLAISTGKSEPGEKFWLVYYQRCDLLRQYREKYGEEAYHQLSEQLDEAREDYVKQRTFVS